MNHRLLLNYHYLAEHCGEHPAKSHLLLLHGRQGRGLCVLHQPRLHGDARRMPDYGIYGFPLEARHTIAAHNAQLFVAYTGAGHCWHSEPDGRQDAIPLYLRR